ncbi:O-antigen ligase family protein [Dongia deserti]|uniref:O-antigen ligase family protein n=1 Tax=Dongia deserti TaxID=2268030 RepID=UPI0013C5240F|nr:hypothetical protein [Dongia deserti]
MRSLIARYVLFALSFRYLMSAHHDFTFDASPIGISWNALGSISVFLLGCLLIRTKHLLLTTLIPFYAVTSVVMMSAYVNHSIGSSIDVVVKFGYLIIITIAVYESISERGEERTMSLLLWAMVTPMLFQFLSVVFGISKGIEGRGAGVSYVGGYNHESGFSTVLATGFVIACFATGLKLWVRGGALLTLLAGILMANYRTAIVAFAPMVFMQFNADVISRFSPRVRIIIGLAILTVSTAGLLTAAWFLREKFADLSIIYSDPGRLIKPPSEYTPDERQLLSARPYIWAGYIDAYVNGGIKNLVLGFGPNAWVTKFPVYAHNTLVSTLYEYGIVGVVAMIVLWGWMIVAALRVKHGPKGKLLAAHGSFLLLNMATMPHWTIEGNLLYAIICGYTFYLLLGPAPKPVPTTAEPSTALAPLSHARPNILK